MKIDELPVELRSKMYEKCDIESLLNFGESNTQFIPEIIRTLNKSEVFWWLNTISKNRAKWINKDV
jgi:hypothetical protein